MKKIFLNWCFPILGSLVALTLLFYLYRDLDASLLIAEIFNANLAWLIMLCLSILAEQLIRGFKWRYIIYDLKPISAYRLFGSILAGYGANTLVPLGISPFVRTWIVARLEGLRLASILTTTAIDRFIDGIIFALIAAGAAFFATLPVIEGNLQMGIAAAGIFNLALFGGLLWLLFVSRYWLQYDDRFLSRSLDWIAAKGGERLKDLRSAIADGILWPRKHWHRLAIILLSVLMKAIAATHFLWASLAVGVLLGFWDYIFLFLLAGFSLVLARFIRIPGGFIIGSTFALGLLGVNEEATLSMILFIHVLTIILMVVPGFIILWRSGINIRTLRVTKN